MIIINKANEMVKLFSSKSKLISVMADLNGRFVYNGDFGHLFSEEVWAMKQENLWTMYIPKTEFDRLNDVGAQIFSDGSQVEKYIDECNRVLECYRKLCENMLAIGDNGGKCFKNIVHMYYKTYSLLMAQYRITNLECTAKLQSDGPYVNMLTQMRWNIRKAFMEGNKIFYDLVKKEMMISDFDEAIQCMRYEDLLGFWDNYGIYEQMNIKKLVCTPKGIMLYSNDNEESDIPEADKQKKKVLRGINVSKPTVVRAKALVLKEGNMDENAIRQLKEEKCIVITVSLHFDITEYRQNIVGLVCDEGGVLSHSAIIAREFDMPCISGTVYGTHNFETGDYVELNTVLGLIRLLEPDRSGGVDITKMNSKFHEYLQSVNCEDVEEIVLNKMDAEVNRELSENCDDYEHILENIFRKELKDGNR